MSAIEIDASSPFMVLEHKMGKLNVNHLHIDEYLSTCCCCFFRISRLEELYPIYIHNTTVEYEGWIRINVTEMVSDWMKPSFPTNILYFTVHNENDRGQLIKSIKDTKFVLGMESTEHQPFITAFFQNHIKQRNEEEQKVQVS